MAMTIDKKREPNSDAKPIWHGVILVAGGAVGAGMFALPLVSAGAWFWWSVLGLVVVCLFTYLAAKLLIDVNAKYPIGSSFDTLVSEVLGRNWARVNNVSIAFIMFVLMYAYITAGAGILSNSLVTLGGDALHLLRPLLSVLFAGTIALFIWFGTSMVSRVSTLLLMAMCLTFLTANAGLIDSLESTALLIYRKDFVLYIWSALPVFVTAFACAGLVPSLSSYYANRVSRIETSVLFGLILALFVYVIWLASTLGSINRESFVEVAENGGGLSALLLMLKSGTDSSVISASLSWFSHFAVITSFLSIGLGLAHFLVDRFRLKGDAIGRAQSVALAFVPPLIASVFAPYGFVSAIAYAGLFVAFSFFIVPALMQRKLNRTSSTRSARGWLSVFAFGVLIIVLKILSVLSLLPSYP